MDFSLPYFIYCENTLGFISQPLNVLTSFAYIGVAIYIWMKSASKDQEFLQITAFLVMMHGMCSIYWHASGVPLGLVFDIISALLLTAVLATVMCDRMLKLPLWGSLFVVVIMFTCSTLLKDAGIPFLTQNGGAFLPPLFLLAFIALKIQATNQTATVYVLCASYTLLFGILFRSIDMAVCQNFSMGTHFMSHICAAVSIVYAVRASEAIQVIEDVAVDVPKRPKNALEGDFITKEKED
jgi:hypothetical protein